MKHAQLADLLRPTDLDGIVGQEHLFGERGVIRRMLAGGRITNMIFYGPPGTGKTTAATIIAKLSGMNFYKLNATSASLADVKEIIAETGNLFGANGILLYLDEIQYFNRKQQQSLLEYIEDGRITLIASTTENPHFFVYNAILSRSSLFEFKAVSAADMRPVLLRALDYLNEENGARKCISNEICDYIGHAARGDVRHSVVLFENAYHAADEEIALGNLVVTQTNGLLAAQPQSARKGGDTAYSVTVGIGMGKQNDPLGCEKFFGNFGKGDLIHRPRPQAPRPRLPRLP